MASKNISEIVASTTYSVLLSTLVPSENKTITSPTPVPIFTTESGIVILFILLMPLLSIYILIHVSYKLRNSDEEELFKSQTLQEKKDIPQSKEGSTEDISVFESDSESEELSSIV
jgi:hypothetical protein